jgi:hypothetical protein
MNRREVVSRVIAALALVLCLSSSHTLATESGGTSVSPTDPNIVYTGRWHQGNPQQPWAYWIGSSIIAEFEGTSIAGTFSAGSGSNSDYLRVIIDGDGVGSSKIVVGTNVSTVTLASGLTNGVHRVEIVKETDQGDWSFQGFQLDPACGLVAPGPRPGRRIEFYGDSNLAGYSLESEQNQGNAHLRGSHFGYAGIASRMLDAEYHNISRSGATIGSLHNRFDRYRYSSPNPAWNFADFTPDLVVVNLGANNVGSSVSNIKQAYHALLDDLRNVHPAAHVMLFNSWGWDFNEPANYIHEVIAERADPNMSSEIFPWIFEQWHGCETDHAGMAAVLVEHLNSVLGWSAVPSDVVSGYGLGGDLANGGFEETAPFGGYGWRYHSDSGVSRVHAPLDAHEGEHYLRLTSGASSHQPIPASDGDRFVVTGWFRGVQAGDRAQVTVDFRNQEMWTTPLQSTTVTHDLQTQWQEFSTTVTAPTGTANPVYHMRVTVNPAAGDTIHVDGLSSRLQSGTSFCAGDGTGSTCPCNGQGSSGEGCANTGGQGGAILYSMGQATLSQDSFTLHVEGIPGQKPGLCVKGSVTLAGGNGDLVGDGLLCTNPQLRSQVLISSTDGSLTLPDWKGLSFGTYPGAANIGATTYYQWWYRDPGNECSGSGFNFTNGWEVDWLP